MWNDTNAFVSFQETSNCYVTLANSTKVPVIGVGTIRFKSQGYILQLNDVFYVPTLTNSLYSIRQHRCYHKCTAQFNNAGCYLNYPQLTINLDDTNDMIFYAQSMDTNTTKIHWSSPPTMHAKTAAIIPKSLLSNSPNPSANKLPTRLTAHDLFIYMGFRQIKNIKECMTIVQPAVKYIEGGDIPHEIAEYLTIQRFTSNKHPIPCPSNFFDIAHMYIVYGDVVAPGNIKYGLLIVDRKTRYSYILPLKAKNKETIVEALTYLKL
jgi:hypothetical protein